MNRDVQAEIPVKSRVMKVNECVRVRACMPVYMHIDVFAHVHVCVSGRAAICAITRGCVC